ncbi:exported hypothetical protein [Nitrosotalea sinensis]|uniref:Uncharacterized protein n=1 Tax=Nitrosotalea sinensis TaxID=1499975 RepID=A0A2H1EHX0_9ARCH|nr:hypothetical protein [Candidatus Nitrosotalea sinensis]SHO45674.1 exported hypothetical protein [Candidatus Nitrosotalea sinensis]
MSSKLVLTALSVLCVSCMVPDLNMPVHASSPIMISMDSYPQVNIVIYAPDFNSSPYAIDTIGEDGSTITISTRESSIPYRLVETGPDTGYFAGSVIVSSTTSSCSPVCGPNDGFLAGGGNDAITVSFTYANGQTITASSSDNSRPVYNTAVPEFPAVDIALVAGVAFLVYFSRTSFIR